MPINPNELAIRDDNNVAGVMGQNEVIGGIENIRVEDGRLIVVNRVWDPDTSTWVRQTQAASDEQTINLLKGDYWHDSRIEYDSDYLPVYVGCNPSMNATTGGTDWLIARIEYDSNYNITRAKVQTTSWDSRAIGW